MNIAAIAVIIASLVAVGAVTGVIPSAHSQKQDVVSIQGRESDDSAVQSDRRKPVQIAAACPQCGVIESIRTVETKGQASGVGAVAGGVAGAVVGSQFGRGTGRTALGVLGAAGGAYAGHEIEKNIKKTTSWSIGVRMEDGSFRTVSRPSQPVFTVDEKVKILNGALVARR